MKNGDFTVVIVAILFLTAIGVGSVLWIGQHKLQMDSSWLIVIGLIPTTIASLLSLLKGYQAERVAVENRQISQDNKGAIQELRVTVDGRISQLLAEREHSATLVERAAGIERAANLVKEQDKPV